MQQKIIFIDSPQKSLDELDELVNIVYGGFMALAIDYAYHIKNIFGSENDKAEIYELRDSISYRIRSANLHFYLLLIRKVEIENRFEQMLKKNPQIFDNFLFGNPHFEAATDEVMALYDSIVFHLSSCFDYLATLIQFVFGKNPENRLQWTNLVKHCHNSNSEFSNRRFVENVKQVNLEFVSKFYDYRSELIHRKKSTSYANVNWEIASGRIITSFQCSTKIKSNLKKVIDKKLEYCITYASYMLIKQTLLTICDILEGINNEFRENYVSNAPVISKGGFQFITMNPETKFAESPAISMWEKFMSYKKYKT